MTLLIITSDQDLTADFLILELIERGLPYFRLNSEEVSPHSAAFVLEPKGFDGWFSTSARRLALSDVSAVWYRRAVHPSAPSELPGPERSFVSGEMRHLISGLASNPALTWVNPVENVRQAEHKLIQLKLAHGLGMHVPRTLVSSDAALLQNFTSENAAGTICKPIYHGLYNDGTARYSVLTRRVRVGELDAEAIGLCPVLLQEEVPRAADVRATFIGNDLFVAEITGIGDAVDWRDPNLPIAYATSELPDGLRSQCRAMLRELGLVYGAFDFIRTPEGRHVFLEVNPTGEWAWLETALGFPMRASFVKALYGPSAV